MEIPTHDVYGHYNEFKTIFNKAVRNTVSLFREMSSLELKTWNPKDITYFSEGRVNAQGLNAYWHAINTAFELWDREVMHNNLNSGTHTSTPLQVNDPKPVLQ